VSKRKISRKQTWRANKIQEERIKRAQKKEQSQQHTSHNQALGREEPGLVIAGFGSQLIVEDQNTHQIACTWRQNLGTIVVGDQVIIQRIDDRHGVITAILPRSSLLERPNFVRTA
jgi:ribosome biogenesis GTPase